MLKEHSTIECINWVGVSSDFLTFRRLAFLELPPQSQSECTASGQKPSESAEHSLLERRRQLEQQCERRATKSEQEVIHHVLPLLYDFIRSIGGTPKTVDSTRILFYDLSRLTAAEQPLLTEEFGVKGGYRPLQGTILIYSGPQSDSLLQCAGVLVHELFHSQAFSNMSPVMSGFPESSLSRQQRIGIRIIRPDKKTTYFKHLDEAVIETLTIRFLNQFGSAIPALAEESQRRTEFIESLPDAARDRARRDIARIIRTPPSKEGDLWKTEIIRYAYPEERDELNRLVAELFEKNAGELDDREQVFRLFVEAVLQGKLLRLARLVEKTFGRGSFRQLGVKRDG